MRRELAKGRRAAAGVTLVELIVSIVVISIGLAGVVLVMSRTTAASADPMVQHQAVAIAEAYMEEILSKDFGVQPETSRASFDDVRDYHGLNQVPTDQNGNAVTGLGQYNVQLLAVPQLLNGSAAILVTVTVNGPGGTSFSLSGYRTDY